MHHYGKELQMIGIDNMSNKEILTQQYKNTDNLNLRQSLHEKYGRNKKSSVFNAFIGEV